MHQEEVCRSGFTEQGPNEGPVLGHFDESAAADNFTVFQDGNCRSGVHHVVNIFFSEERSEAFLAAEIFQLPDVLSFELDNFTWQRG